MPIEKNCPACGTALGTSAVDGLCPKCLGRLAFAGTDDQSLSELRRLGDYELLEEIARGGMGVVYRARQLSLNRVVAVKVVLSGPFADHEFVRRFHTEAEAAAALQHPNIVSVHEIGERDGVHFLSMDFVEGKNFSELVRDQPLPARRAADYLRTIALAVQHAHERGVLHRDLKPSNILLDVFDQPRITDFGLAKFLHRDAESTVPGALLGSPNFIPPEQAAGKFSKIAAHSDVYSLGGVLYQLLAGRPPFQGETLTQILQQVQNTEPVPPRKLNPGVPADLQTICLKCLQKDPARRYATARGLADDLTRFLEGQAIRARPVSRLETAWLWCKRRPALATMIVALHLTLGAGLAGILYEWHYSSLHARGEMRQRLLAEENAAAMRLNLYAADVALAGQVMQQGDFGRARRTLERLIPLPGETDLRGFEWRYLWKQCEGAQAATLGQHEWIVTCVAFSPDGKTIASGGMGGQVKIWDAENFSCRQTLNVFTSTVWSVAFMPGGREIMVGSLGGVKFIDPASGRTRTNFPGRLAAISHDGTLLAAAESSPFFFDETGPVTLWNPLSGERRRTLAETGRAVALSADGVFLAVATQTTGVRLYNAASGNLLRTLPTNKSVWSLHFSPDGNELLSAGWSGEVSLWKTASDSAPRIISANHLNLNVWDADFSPDGNTIITTSSDQTIRFWDHATLEQKNVLRGHQSEVWCAAFSPDGRKIVTGGKDQNVMLWTVPTLPSRTEIAQLNACSPMFSLDGTRLITANPDPDGAYALWDTTSHIRLAKNLALRHIAAGFSQDGSHVVVLSADRRALEFYSFNDKLARTVALQKLPESAGDFAFWGMSPDAEFFFAIDATGIVRVWDVANGVLQKTIPGPAAPIRNAVLSPHGTLLAISVERENPVYLFDVLAGKKLMLTGHHDFVSGLAFSPDGTTLATGSMDGNIRLWRTADGLCLGVLPGHLQETTDLAFSPDGRTLASIGQRESLKLWHLPTMREVFSESLPKAGRYLQFSPDGKRLAVNTDEDKLLILEAP